MAEAAVSEDALAAATAADEEAPLQEDGQDQEAEASPAADADAEEEEAPGAEEEAAAGAAAAAAAAAGDSLNGGDVDGGGSEQQQQEEEQEQEEQQQQERSPDGDDDAAAPPSYGAAAASLASPACRPGTVAFADAKAANDVVLREYNKWKAHYEGFNQKKPDMKAAREVGNEGRANTYGHLPGVAAGEVFRGRGELAVLGLHGQMMQGINSRNDARHGAFAICLSGGYTDDGDLGRDLWHTGAGGQDGKKQVKDQTFESADNAALVGNYESGTPVRVFRGRMGKAPGDSGRDERHYIYEGLYQVVAKRRVQSKDGPLDNRIVGPGIRYPLEVFKTKEGKGWGVRCACDVPAGALLCCYIGNVITDRFAEMLRGLDAYLFDLNHFQQLLMPPEEGRGDENEDGGEDEGENDVQQEQQGGPDGGGSGNQQQQTQQANGQHQQQQANGQQQQQQQRKRPPPAADDERDEVNPNLPPLPADLRDNHLVVDASHEGNVARFINHSCDPNCCLQTVFSGRCRSLLLHYVAVVAVEDIPAFTELTYNYYYMKGTDGETLAAMAAMASDDDTGARRIPCTCGAANCSKWLMIN